MPIYEYRASTSRACPLCKEPFEQRQAFNDASLSECPDCGAPIRRLLSRQFIAITDTLAAEDTYETYTDGEADRLGLEGGFGEDQVWK